MESESSNCTSPHDEASSPFVPTQGDESAWEAAHLAELRDAGIARTIRHACARAAFWSRWLADAGLEPADIRTAADLAALPPIEKAVLATHGQSLWCVPPNEVLDIVTTSGTTGEPVTYPLTASDIHRLGYNEFRSFTCAGVRPGDIVLLAVTMDRCFMAGLAYYEGLKQLGATVVRVGSGSPGMLLTMMKRLKATVIVSVPSFLRLIADYAHERGMDLAGSTVRKLVCIGEPVRGKDGALTPLAATLGSDWGATVYATYGATEIAGSLCECDAGCGGHLHPDLLHLEVVREDGQPASDGEVGELVATTLGVEALPLLRFRTGDLTWITHSPCSCGRRTPRIGPILGRLNQMLKVKGTTVYPLAVQQALEALPEVDRFVLIATFAGPLSDELEVVATVHGEPAMAARCIQAHLQAELKVTPTVRIADPQELKRWRDPANNRKPRLFIDRRQHRGSS